MTSSRQQLLELYLKYLYARLLSTSGAENTVFPLNFLLPHSK